MVVADARVQAVVERLLGEQWYTCEDHPNTYWLWDGQKMWCLNVNMLSCRFPATVTLRIVHSDSSFKRVPDPR